MPFLLYIWPNNVQICCIKPLVLSDDLGRENLDNNIEHNPDDNTNHLIEKEFEEEGDGPVLVQATINRYSCSRSISWRRMLTLSSTSSSKKKKIDSKIMRKYLSLKRIQHRRI